MKEGEYEVRNRHGDVVQRGEIEITDVKPGDMGMAYEDPAKMKPGDTLRGRIPEEAIREFLGE